MNENIEFKIRHLEMIQGLISRMASNSFMLKGWAITLVAGVFALSAKDANSLYFLIAYVPIILFWFLDSHYLQMERQFKVLYKAVANNDKCDTQFKLERPKANWAEETCYLQSLISRTEELFYIPTALLITLVVVLSRSLLS